VKDRLVCGITDNVTRERLLREEDLTRERAEKICNAAELVKERSKELSTTGAATVHAVLPTKKPRGTKKQQTAKQHTDKEKSVDASAKKQGSPDDRARKHHCRQCDTWHGLVKVRHGAKSVDVAKARTTMPSAVLPDLPEWILSQMTKKAQKVSISTQSQSTP